jgi:uncharacterized membrane protein YgcG
MSGVKDTVASGRSIAVDFVQRRRVDDPAERDAPEYEDPEALEATSLLERVTGGAVAPTSAPGEPDEFFDELRPDPTEPQPSDVEELDPWIARQAQPDQTKPTTNQASANGTAGLAGDVPLVRSAARRERASRHPRSLPRPHLPVLPRLRVRTMLRPRRRALGLGATVLAGIGVLAALGALFSSSGPSRGHTTAASFNPTAAAGPAFPGLAHTISGSDTALTRATHAAARSRSSTHTRKPRPHPRAHKPPVHDTSPPAAPAASSAHATTNYTPTQQPSQQSSQPAPTSSSGSEASSASTSGGGSSSGSSSSGGSTGAFGQGGTLGPGHSPSS